LAAWLVRYPRMRFCSSVMTLSSPLR